MDADREYYEDVLVPGFIVASSGVQFGDPCLMGTRIPYDATWVWEFLDRPADCAPGITREQIIALAAFHAGVEWRRSRKRRHLMAEAVKQLWRDINAEAQAPTPAGRVVPAPVEPLVDEV